MPGSLKKKKGYRTWWRLCPDLPRPQLSRRLLPTHLGRPHLCLLLRAPLLLLLGRTGCPRRDSLHMSFKAPLYAFALLEAPLLAQPLSRMAWRGPLM